MGDASKIVVCDDHEILRRTVVAILEQEGFDVAEAPSIELALDEVGRTHPDLVIMDLRVGEGSGIDAIARIRGNPAIAATPVLLMSGEALGTEGGPPPGGADAFVTKPFELPAFVDLVKGLVKGDAPGY